MGFLCFVAGIFLNTQTNNFEIFAYLSIAKGFFGGNQ